MTTTNAMYLPATHHVLIQLSRNYTVECSAHQSVRFGLTDGAYARLRRKPETWLPVRLAGAAS